MKKKIKVTIMLMVLTILSMSLIACNAQEKLVNKPSKQYAVECLKKVPGIIEVEVATETTDINGQLNKKGGYTAFVVFLYDKVDQSELYEEILIEKGTDAGGSVEVYTSKKDAEKRDEY